MTKFIVSSLALLKQLEKLKGALGSNPALPILEDYLLEVRPGELRLTASNLDVRLSTTLEVEAVAEGRLAVPGRQLLDVLKHLPDQPLTATLDPDAYALHLQAGANTYRLAGEDPRGYPRPPEFEAVGSLEMSAGRLQRALTKTVDYASTNADDAPFDAVGFRVTDKCLEFTAGSPILNLIAQYRQSFDSVSWPEAEGPRTMQTVAPARNLKLLLGLLPKTAAVVSLHFCERHFMAQVGELLFSCRRHDGDFPPLGNAIPKGSPYSFVADRQELLGAMRRFAGFVDEKTQCVRFGFSPLGTQVSATPRDGASEACETLPGTYTGSPLVLGLRLQNVLTALPHLDGEDGQVRLELAGPGKAVLFTPAKLLTGEELRVITMPLMLDF